MKKILFIGLLIIGMTSFQALACMEEGEQAVPMYEVSGTELNSMLINYNDCCLDYNMPVVEYFATANGEVVHKRIKNEEVIDIDTNNSIALGYNYCRKNVIIDADFVNFINSKEKMEGLLQNAGSKGTVKRWCLMVAEHDMYAEKFPLTIYIEANDNKGYFVTVEPLSEQSSFMDVNDFVDECAGVEFNVLNQYDYYTKYGIKSARLVIENADHNFISDINIQKNDIYIPIRTLLEQLGSKVIWHSEDESVEFKVNNIIYRFYLNGATRLCRQNASNMELVQQ